MNFKSEIKRKIKSYVYLYIDPRNRKIFYIGKGNGNRVFSHMKDVSESEKVKRIKAIQKAGKEPIIEILRYGLKEDESALLEAVAIDLFGKKNLTNQVLGHESSIFGRTSVKEIIARYQARPVKVKPSHKIIAITINKLYRYDMNDGELYDATRGFWRVGGKRQKAKFAFAVYRGVIKEVYEILKWQPDTQVRMKYRTMHKKGRLNRWGFTGKKANNKIRTLYVGKNIRNYIKPGSQNPIRYINL